MKKQILTGLLILSVVTTPLLKSNFACAAETTSSIGSVTEDINNETKVEWKKYLTVAARFYKYPFNDQIMIYAQRPDATACAPIEIWNRNMRCLVKRGAHGIALLDFSADKQRINMFLMLKMYNL
ncbi:MAG: hypothetical protein KIC94_14905 [Clostridiales bacterium]|nr:hypothetical protein [Clostridiales bacterium]